MTNWFRVAGPTEPTNLQLLAMIYGATCLIFSMLVGMFYMSDKCVADDAASRAPTQATISNVYLRHGRGPYKEWRLDYTRQTPKGPVSCKDALVELHMPNSPNYAIGNVIDIYPRPDSCHKPVHAATIGTSKMTYGFALFWLVLGLTMFGGGYYRYRMRRQRALMKPDALAA